METQNKPPTLQISCFYYPPATIHASSYPKWWVALTIIGDLLPSWLNDCLTDWLTDWRIDRLSSTASINLDVMKYMTFSISNYFFGQNSSFLFFSHENPVPKVAQVARPAGSCLICNKICCFPHFPSGFFYLCCAKTGEKHLRKI